jgi:hypothetical protein
LPNYDPQQLKSLPLRKGAHYRWRPIRPNVTEMWYPPAKALLRVQPAVGGGYAVSVSDANGTYIGTQLLNMPAGDAERKAGEIAERMLAA